MAVSRQIRGFDRNSTQYDVCDKASLILDHAHDSAKAILKAFDMVRAGRGRGTTTDEEQDLLRAMLVMSAAGLDAMAKQLVRDALPFVVHDNEIARSSLESFIENRLSQDFESIQEGRRAKYVPAMLASSDLQQRTVTDYIQKLTAGSLQSADELLRIAAAFGLTERAIKTDFVQLKDIFEIRNKIIHELDINLSAARRNRNTRSRSTLVREANRLLAAGEDLLIAVDRQIAECQSE